MILCDTDIEKVQKVYNLLTPFVDGVQDGVISYGLSSHGYDLRLGHKILVFKNSYNERVSPKRFKSDPNYAKRLFDEITVEKDGDVFIAPPHSYLLAYSLEYIRMPNHLAGQCVGKSTFARCGLVVNTTPIESAWEGHLTIEIANTSPCPVDMFAGEGMCQMLLFMLSGIPRKTYKDKKGKYDRQGAEPIPARVSGKE